MEFEINTAKLILSANNALLGEIRINMRRIYVEYEKEKNKITLYFVYYTPPSEEDIDYDVEGVIITEMSCFFSDDVKWDSKSIVIPYPQRITPPSDICVYSRYEMNPDKITND